MSNLIKNVKDWTDDLYYQTGIHYSALQSIHNNEVYKLDPAQKEAVRAEMDGKQVVNNGKAFEDYIEDYQLYDKRYYILTAERSSNAMENKLIDVLIEKNIDPNDTEKVLEAIKEAKLWVSDNANKRIERANLDMGVKQYVIEQQYLARDGKGMIQIPTATHSAIVESSMALETKYPELFHPKGDILVDEMQVVLEYGEFVCKLDRLIIYKDSRGGMYARVLDYKFKNSDPSTWHESFYWKYGYWIQGVLYSYIVKNCLSDDVTFEGFWFVIGSNSHPQKSCVVEHPAEIDLMMYNSVEYPSGYIIPSVMDLKEEYDWHMEDGRFTHRMKVHINGGYFKPYVPLVIQHFEEL